MNAIGNLRALPKGARQFWTERSASERRTLIWGAAILAALVFYLLLVGPAIGGIARLERQLPQARARAAQLESLAGEAKGLRALPAAASAGVTDLRTALDTSLRNAGLAASAPVTLPNGDLRLHFEHVAYGPWSSWLANAEHALGVHALSVQAKAAGPGNADIDLTLRVVHG